MLYALAHGDPQVVALTLNEAKNWIANNVISLLLLLVAAGIAFLAIKGANLAKAGTRAAIGVVAIVIAALALAPGAWKDLGTGLCGALLPGDCKAGGKKAAPVTGPVDRPLAGPGFTVTGYRNVA